MSSIVTKTMIQAYDEHASQNLRTPFFSTFFKTPEVNFFNSKTVEFDVRRADQTISIAVQSLDSGYRKISEDKFVNKEYEPPVFADEFMITASHDREFGNNPYQNDRNFGVYRKAYEGISTIQDRIMRSNELQASQILTTGSVTLKDSASNTIYTLSFDPKSAHFANAGTAWNAGGYNPFTDIQAMASEIRNDTGLDADQIIFGEGSFLLFMSYLRANSLLDQLWIDNGRVKMPENMNNGGTYHGSISIGSYIYQLWTYTSKYRDPISNAMTAYLPNDKVIVRSSLGRMDAVFGSVPTLGLPMDTPIVSLIPPRMKLKNIDLYIDAQKVDSRRVKIGVSCRPLFIPTAIDSFGCIDTGI